jgi:hypothetical protein
MLYASRSFTKPEYNVLYDLLFCDHIDLNRPDANTPGLPEELLNFPALSDSEQLLLAENTNFPSRWRILAYRHLQESIHPAESSLLGIIIEIHHEAGLDVLAVYDDLSARLLHHSGQIRIVESAPLETWKSSVEQLFSAAKSVLPYIGPWQDARKPPPGKGMGRISFLKGYELYFGEGPIAALYNDALAGPVLQSGEIILESVIAISTP